MKKDNLSIILVVCAIIILSIALLYNIFGDKALTLIKEREDKAIRATSEYVEKPRYDISVTNKSEYNIPEDCNIESVVERFYKDNYYDEGNYTLELEYFKEDVTFENRYMFKFKNMDVYGDAYYIKESNEIFIDSSLREDWIVNIWSEI